MKSKIFGKKAELMESINFYDAKWVRRSGQTGLLSDYTFYVRYFHVRVV